MNLPKKKSAIRKEADYLVLERNQLQIRTLANTEATKKLQNRCSHRLITNGICPECDFVQQTEEIKKEPDQ
jgi:hypothetical protein